VKKEIRFHTSILRPMLALLLLLGLGIGAISAQDHPRPAAQVSKLTTAISRKLGPDQRGLLSTAANNLLHLAESGAVNRVITSSSGQQAVRQLLANRMSRKSTAVSNPVPVNDAGIDFVLSRLAGFTQNGSSNAWCGQNIVVGYNDSAALLLTAAMGGSISFSGVAVSHDAGTSFQPSPFLDAGADPANFLAGESVIACSGKNFYYASLFDFLGAVDPTTGEPRLVTSVGVNRSSDGGDTWSAPIPAVQKNGDNHIVDKEWLTVDPNNPDHLYVSYTDFDFAFKKDNGCDGGVRVAIELVASNNGGHAWSQPAVVDQLCNPGRGQALQASQVVVGNSGEIFVAWVSETSTDEQIFFRSSTDGGLRFSDPVLAGNAILAGLGGSGKLQSLFKSNSFPSLSVDRSSGASRGTLYLTWIDASRNQIPDFLAPTQTYDFGDVVVSRSTDKGTTWTPAKVVSPASHIAGSGRDQFLPSAAVDSEGTLAICYFDRRRDPDNNGVDRYCSISHDQGTSFTHIRNTPKSWAPTHLTDGLMDGASLGDYDGLSSDASGATPGFFSSFQTQGSGNPDIVGARF
jgi:hypothetical protein